MWLFVAFLAVPLIEIALFVQVGGLIGLWPTLGLVLLSAVAGTMLMRAQGLRALGELQRSFAEMRDPTRPLAHGAMILIAGMLLLTPGFFTDTLGLLLLVPAVRDAAMRAIARRVRVVPAGGDMGADFGQPRRPDPHRPPFAGGVIDGDYVDLSEPPPAPGPRRPSRWTTSPE